MSAQPMWCKHCNEWGEHETNQHNPKRTGARARNRGARGEREVVELLKACGWPRSRRNLLRDVMGRQERGDIAGGPPGVSFEVKFVEKLNLPSAWRQCVQAAGSDLPVVVHRSNGQPWLCTLPADELFALLRLKESL